MTNDPTNPFTEDEEACRRTVRAFLDRELEPHHERFVGDLEFDREFWRKAGRAGILGASIPPEYGGPGLSDLVSVVVAQELGRSVGGATVGSSLAADLATHVLMAAGSQEQKRRLTPRILTGESTQCFALTEPGAGSDATAIRTSAIRDGDAYVVNGTKVFISNGNKADIIYLAAKTDPTRRGAGISMLIVEVPEAGLPGLSRTRLATMGYDAYDLAELHFSDVRVPLANVLLGEGRGMETLMSTFALDRMQVAARALAEAELAYRLAVEQVRTRTAFGKKIADYQNTQFVLAEMATELRVGGAFLADAIRRYRAGMLDFAGASMVKLWIPAAAGRVIDHGLQLFGGSGYMDEMPISRLYRANRLHRIYAGTDELQKIAIARAL